MADETFRLKVMLEKGEVHIHANRAGLRDLAKVCTGLSALSEEDAKTAGVVSRVLWKIDDAASGRIV